MKALRKKRNKLKLCGFLLFTLTTIYYCLIYRPLSKKTRFLQDKKLQRCKPELTPQQCQLVLRLHEITTYNISTPAESYTQPCNASARACTSNCSKPLQTNLEGNLLNTLTSAKFYLKDETLLDILAIGKTIPENDVIIMSASSSDHYHETQAMFYNLHNVVFPLVENLTVVLFDIGLTLEQRQETEKHCRCKVIKFPSERFPPHVKKNYCYAWKPIIMRAMMERARKVFIYQDSTIRWTEGIIDVMKRATDIGLQLFRRPHEDRIPIDTLIQAFDYFEEKPCAFDPFPHLLAGIAVYRRDVFNARAILEPWAKCALVPECICPVASPESVRSCKSPVAYHRCHRFDQSALGMITAILFNKEIFRVISPDLNFKVKINRTEYMPQYFNSLEKHLNKV
ncbi:uncharacterized protein LOC131940941 [Physella acuta]|uniref:uncharacterized protein LOC131940941 n=1 Tax=Physella acuta TaxID=109671 RepID=UPI0027DB185B|nr:uncharacterized protein LOC131940941 [Physella acuta]